MSYFSSERERRLWLWTLVVVVAIYASLGFARTLAEVLHDRGLVDSIFVTGFFLALVAIFLHGLRMRFGRVEIIVWLGVIAAYLMVAARVGIPEERTHLFEYTVVALFIYEALMERVNQGRAVLSPPLLAILLTSVIGTLDECIQLFLPGRVFDPIDILFNLLAATMAVSASVALAWARRLTMRL
ncbi:MAG: VanZ family protein [Pseudomonadota bacterium]